MVDCVIVLVVTGWRCPLFLVVATTSRFAYIYCLSRISFVFLAFLSTNKMSIESGERTFYYMTRESLCFLAMTESKYPKRTGFLYLDEICDLILQELIREYGNNVSRLLGICHEFIEIATFAASAHDGCAVSSLYLCHFSLYFVSLLCKLVAHGNRQDRSSVSFHQLRSPPPKKAKGIPRRTPTTIQTER